MNEQQIAEVANLKSWFPFRICFGAISPAGEFEAHAQTTMRRANSLVRKGWRVWVVQGVSQ